MATREIDPRTAEYARDYQLGWAASRRNSPNALENADIREVSHAWYDGYLDYAAGRMKWTWRVVRTNGPLCGHVAPCDVDCYQR